MNTITDTPELYYPIKETEISYFVRSSGSMDQSTRNLAQQIYYRGAVSLSGDVKLIKDLNYRIYKLENELRNIYSKVPELIPNDSLVIKHR